MLEQNNISNFYQKAFVVTILFCVATAFESMAQSREADRNMPEIKVEENLGAMESPEGGLIEPSTSIRSSSEVKGGAKDKLSATNPASNPLYRQGGEKDAKRENVSTLSFNLFLYIVDKFKED